MLHNRLYDQYDNREQAKVPNDPHKIQAESNNSQESAFVLRRYAEPSSIFYQYHYVNSKNCPDAKISESLRPLIDELGVSDHY